MSKQFQLGDKVNHDFSQVVGTVVGLRVAKPYTVKVEWHDSGAGVKKDWYKPEVLIPYKAHPMNEVADRLIEITDGKLTAQQYRELDSLIKDQRQYG